MIIIPLGILALVGAAGAVRARRERMASDPEVQAQRKMVYETLIGAVDPNTACKDPVRLRNLADAFEGEGMLAEASMLRKRAALRELPPEVAAARKDALRKLLASTNVEAVLNGADAFESEGCTGAANRLREYAAGLSTATEEKTDEQA